MLRRKTIPEALRPSFASFERQAERVQQAREALLACLPVGRVERAPLPVGLDLLRDELTEVAGELGAWRVAQVEAQWEACDAAIREALEAVPRAHEVVESSSELEELLGAVADVVEPLGDAFSAAERRWRALRTRPRAE